MGEMCSETAGEWWWLPALLLGFGAAVMAFVMLLLLGDGWAADDQEEDAGEGVVVTRWQRLRSWLPSLVFAFVTVPIVTQMTSDEGRPVGELAARVAVLTVGVVGLGSGFARVVPVASSRAVALASGRSLDVGLQRRVSRARWAVGVVLVVSTMVSLVMLGLHIGTTVDVSCPE